MGRLCLNSQSFNPNRDTSSPPSASTTIEPSSPTAMSRAALLMTVKSSARLAAIPR